VNGYDIRKDIANVRSSLAGRWFSPGTLVYSTNKNDHHDITESVESGVKHHKPKPTY
jgi:hypothetical protein